MNKVNITELGIKEVRDLLNKKEISATELTNAYIQNIEDSSKLNAFIEKTFNKDEFVRKIDVDLANGQVLIAYSADKLINQEEISDLILANGQNVTGIEIIRI